MTYWIKVIDSVRFMASSLSTHAGNLAEELYNSKCKDCKSCLNDTINPLQLFLEKY